MAYDVFSRYYDALTHNVNYLERARYFDCLLRMHGSSPGILLDVGCGTGSLSVELAALGYDVIGADPSMEMLSVAMQKRAEANQNILLLHQGMEELDLYGTVDGAICALDTINHITDKDILAAGFAKVSLFLAPGGVFVFDVNTPYKHQKVLADNVFVYDLDEVYCVWQNQYDTGSGDVEIHLDFFVPGEGGAYNRYSEDLTERAYSCVEIEDMLAQAGLELLAVYEGDTLSAPAETSQRLVYAVRKPLRSK